VSLQSNKHLLAGFFHIKYTLQKGLFLHGILSSRFLRQEDLKTGTAFRTAVDSHRAVVMVNNKEACQQVEAVFFGIALAHKKRIKDAMEICRGYSRAVIHEFDFHPGTSFIIRGSARRNGDLARCRDICGLVGDEQINPLLQQLTLGFQALPRLECSLQCVSPEALRRDIRWRL